MAEHLITTPAVLGTCPRCGTWLLSAHSGGLLTRAEIAPLDETAEAAAILTGKPTYNLIEQKYPRRLFLEWRCAIHIAAERRWTVVVAHTECNNGFLPWKPSTPQSAALSETPPY